MRIGYARISTPEQHLELQYDALHQAGCDKIIVDQSSGASMERPGLARLMDILRAGDTLVVCRLDRLGRSLTHLIAAISELEQHEVGLQSLHESIDTTSAAGKLIFHVFGALAEFERQLIRERTQAGLSAARARGRQGGRPPTLDAQQRAVAVGLYKARQHTVKDICHIMDISKPTLYSYVRQAGRGV